jgi:hypothetical protein
MHLNSVLKHGAVKRVSEFEKLAVVPNSLVVGRNSGLPY